MKPFTLFPQLNNLNKHVSLINTKPVCILSLLIPAIQVKPYLCFSRFASVCCKLRWPHIVQGVGRTFMIRTQLLPNISLLLSTTVMAMNVGAKATNKVVNMSDKSKVRPSSPNPVIAAAASNSKQYLLQLRMLQSSPQSHQDEIDLADSNLQKSRYEFKKEVRAGLAAERDAQDSFLHNIISNPSTVFKKLRANNRSSTSVLKRLQVGDNVYSNERVPDGMFDSLNALKAPDLGKYSNSPPYTEAVSTYQHLIKIASAGSIIPPISLTKAEQLLRSLKSSVMDYFSITTLHFLHLGEVGVRHFAVLLNAIINLINSSSVSELNTVWVG